MDPADARRKARGMTHNLIPQTGLNLIKLIFIEIIFLLDEQRMPKKKREQKMDVEVFSLSPNSSAAGDESDKSPSSKEAQDDTSPITKRLRPSTKRRHIIFKDDDDSASADEVSSRKRQNTPDSESCPAKGVLGFDSDSLEFETGEPSGSLQVLKPSK
jgi:hypothetical protein